MSDSQSPAGERLAPSVTCPKCSTVTTDPDRKRGDVIRCRGCGVLLAPSNGLPRPDTPYPFLHRIPRSVSELRDWLAEANAELTDIAQTWTDFVSFVYDCSFRNFLYLSG